MKLTSHRMRDKGKFASSVLAFIDQNLPHTFYAGNIDGICYKVTSKILRIFDWKKSQEKLTPGQEEYFPILNQLIMLGIEKEKIAPNSSINIIRKKIDEIIDEDIALQTIEQIKIVANNDNLDSITRINQIKRLIKNLNFYTEYSLGTGNVIIQKYQSNNQLSEKTLYQYNQFIDLISCEK